jgi:hypothetical protein
MANKNETGHLKNVANFEELLAFVMGYGTDFRPTKNSIKLESMLSVSTNARNALSAVNLALPPYTNAVAARESAFEPVGKLVTRIVNALIATDASKKVIASVKSLGRKIHGIRATPKKTEAEKKAILEQGKEIAEISSSQMGYDNQVENLDKLIKLLASIALYDPNEADLKVSALIDLYNDLQSKNSAVRNVAAPLSNARIMRNQILYTENSGLFYVASDVKTYVKSLYGARSPQYKQISKLTFKNVKS